MGKANGNSTHSKQTGKLSREETLFMTALSLSLALRQLGLLMVIPFISVYVLKLKGGTPMLAGLALGIYGLVQAFLQVPYGYASDRFGRKPVLLFGQIVFAVGYFSAAFTATVFGFLIARILQGMGAVSSVIYAWVGDFIEPSKRNKAMGILGASMGISASLSFIAGPILFGIGGMKFLLLLTGILALIAAFLVVFYVHEKNDGKESRVANREEEKVKLRDILNIKLMFIFSAGLLSNYFMISFFYGLPLLATKIIPENSLWKIYVPASVVGILVLRIAVKFADRGKEALLVSLSFALSGASFLALKAAQTLFLYQLAAFLLFSGYMVLTSLLPSMITKMVGARVRGTTTGIYNTLQFIGSFLGGSLTGLLWSSSVSLALIVPFLLGSAAAIAALYAVR